MSDETSVVSVDVEIPQYGIEINDGPDGTPSYYSLNILTSGTIYKAYLCEAGDGQRVARAFTQKLTQADRDARKRMHAGLVIPDGVMSNGLRTTEGR